MTRIVAARQWQALNAAILAQPVIQRRINPERDESSERDIVRRNLAFYVLNVALQLERAYAAGLIDHDTAARLRSSHAAFLSTLRPEVTRTLAESPVSATALSHLFKS
jgi:hypothetical protein